MDETIEWEPPTPEDNPSADQFYFDAVQRRLDLQIESSDEINRRVATSFGIASTVLPVTISLLNLAGSSIDLAAKSAVIGALGAYAVLIACCFAVARQGDIDYRPDLVKLEGLLDAYDGSQVRLWIAKDRAWATRANHVILARKVRFGNWVVRMLYLEGSLLALAAVVTVR